MTQLSRTLALCLAVTLTGSGCSVLLHHRPAAAVNKFRESPPRNVAILPFENASGEPSAGGAARDTLFYALFERGFKLLPPREIDQIIGDPGTADLLRRADGRIDPRAAAQALGADAVVLGRVNSVKRTDTKLGALNRISAEVHMIDAGTATPLWTDRASALVPILERLRRDDSATPAERKQAALLRLCRSFDRFWWRLRRSIPSMTPSDPLSRATVRKIMVRPDRPIVSAGDSVNVIVEATPDCLVRATLGTLGKDILLEEAMEVAPGVYRGTYRVRAGDVSEYCRIIATIEAGQSSRRRVSPLKSAFIIDAVPPAPPTSPTFETRIDGVRISWNAPAANDLAHYLVYRSDEITGGVRLIGSPEESVYLDRHVRPGRQHYFVKAVDRAGNPSVASDELVIQMPARGPSTVGGIVEGETRWTAYGGPYRLTEDVDVAPGSLLRIEPGTRIEIPPGTEITVRGTVEAIGREDAPIRFEGNESSCGFHVADEAAQLHAAHVEISNSAEAIRVTAGKCHLDHVKLARNRMGVDAVEASVLSLTNSRLERNQFGARVGPNAEVRSTAFTGNEVGLRVNGDGARVEACRFDNVHVDVAKIGLRPLEVDGCTFWTGDPASLYNHLWGNVTCRRILVRSMIARREKVVTFEPVAVCEAKGEDAATAKEWEHALAKYKEGLLQERDRGLIDRALLMYKQLVDIEAAGALEREIAFCRSAVLCYPRDVRLLSRMAELYFRIGSGQMGRQICARLLEVDPHNEYAQKRLEAAAPTN